MIDQYHHDVLAASVVEQHPDRGRGPEHVPVAPRPQHLRAADPARPRTVSHTGGRPEMLRAWRYGDVFGAQSSVGVLFDYRGREHVVMVLVDHLLGGGVKDCWVSEGLAAKDMRNS